MGGGFCFSFFGNRVGAMIDKKRKRKRKRNRNSVSLLKREIAPSGLL